MGLGTRRITLNAGNRDLRWNFTGRRPGCSYGRGFASRFGHNCGSRDRAAFDPKP